MILFPSCSVGHNIYLHRERVGKDQNFWGDGTSYTAPGTLLLPCDQCPLKCLLSQSPDTTRQSLGQAQLTLPSPAFIILQRSNQSVAQVWQKECSYGLEPSCRETRNFNSSGCDGYARAHPLLSLGKENPLDCPTRQPSQKYGWKYGHYADPHMRPHNWWRTALRPQ